MRELKHHRRRHRRCGCAGHWGTGNSNNNSTNSSPTSTWYFFSHPKIYIFASLFFLVFFLLFRCSDSKCLASLISACRFAHISCKIRDSVFTCDFYLNDSIMHRFFDIFFYANRWPWVCARNESHVICSNRFDDSFSERFHSNLQRHQFSHWTENGIRIVWFGCEIWFFFFTSVILAGAYFMLFPLYFCWRCSSKYLNERKNQHFHSVQSYEE